MAEPVVTDLREHAHSLLERTAYLTLGTVDPDGRPWTSPVYFAADGLDAFYWTSTPNSRHSRNLAAHPAVSLVVFDSTVEPFHGRALYAEGTAGELTAEEIGVGLGSYPRRDGRGDGTGLCEQDVTGASAWRLYRATASAVWVLCPREPRRPCPLHGRSDDHRVRVC